MRRVSFPFYNSAAWKKCRAAYLKSVCGMCEECAKSGLAVPADIVHHKIPLDDSLARDPEIALNFDHLEAVCMDCHNRIHFGQRVKRRYQMEGDTLTISE